MRESLLIVGASVRAAAQSAARLGLLPVCGDLFGDADLPDACVGRVARSFPGDLVRIAEEVPAGPWMYTGGLENHPRVVAKISRRRELLGNSPATLRGVRDPFILGRVLVDAGFLFPECRESSDGLPRDGRWLRKQRRASGGLRVERWSGKCGSSDARGSYYQRYLDGLPLGVVYIAAAGRARLVGVSEQIVTGTPQAPFRYGGSIAPLTLPPPQREYLSALGDVLALQFDLRGLFGVDLILAAEGLWAIEVNPRYTASVELFERAFSFNAIELHLAACRDGRLPDSTTKPQARWHGKSILYSGRSQRVPSAVTSALCGLNASGAWPAVADIPRAGTDIAPGQPVVTVFAEAADRSALQVELARRTEQVRALLGG
ncbi:MAG: hypothetical protein B7Z73_02795 [Planctomycetia bacterium 21-64-5]|nr:MAG: hypothetical protein B7Z73_02795 [Planctomycetia bacterium 21-64-5]HQU43053.1 ATP-grasp domain-containing protein [Pirellulales bacterium]